jgi:lysozyme
MNKNNPTTVTTACTDLIKDHEGFSLRAYLCPANRLTIGWGHMLMAAQDYGLFKISKQTLANIIAECSPPARRPGEEPPAPRLTEEAKRLYIITNQAEQLLSRDVSQTVIFLRSTTQVTLSQNQFDALVSFIFNVGQGNYATSTLKKKLNAGDYEGAAAEFDRWVYGTVYDKKLKKKVKQKLNGLITRRAAERALFEGNP